MCDKCVEIDEKVEHYRRLVALITDQLTNERLGELIADLLAQKVALHPEQDE
jgi:hypothetical protein